VIARLNVGGTARYISQLAEELPKQGIEIYIATGYVQGAEIEDNQAQFGKILRIPSLGRAVNPVKDLKAHNQLKQIIKDIKPDIIHSHTFKAGFLVRIGKTKVPVIHTYHGHLLDDPEFRGLKSRVIIMLERKLAKKSARLVSVGKNVGTELQLHGIGIESQFVNIPPGVTALKITPRAQAFQNLGITDDSMPTVGWIARVTGVKNPIMALEVAREIPNVHFIMAGGGDLLEMIKTQAPPNVSVLGWSKAEDLIGASNIIFSTSENEGMPIALIEAQMAGVPVVATNVGSVGEVIENGATGFVTNNELQEITTQLRKLILDVGLQNTFSQNAKVTSERFSIKNLVDAHVILYNEVLA